MEINNLEDLMVEELKDLYSAERQITQALPKMVEEAQSSELRQALETHLEQTREQVRRLEDVFDTLDVTDREKHCKGMEAIIHEGEEMIKEASNSGVKDATLIAAAQHVEHYEMAGYGTVISYAHQLDQHDVAEQLQTTLREEKEADLLLSKLAEDNINPQAY
jgi:ferritin-like metal-binding protein YciE